MLSPYFVVVPGAQEGVLACCRSNTPCFQSCSVFSSFSYSAFIDEPGMCI